MDRFERRGLNSDLRALKIQMADVQKRLEEDEEEQESLGVKTIEMASDGAYNKSYTVSRMVLVKWHCTCPDARYRSPGECKHILRAQGLPLYRFK